LAPEKFVHVPNGVSCAEWSGTPVPVPADHQAFLDVRHDKGRFLIGYCGAYGVANALGALIHAASYLKNYPIEVVLVGTGPERKKLIAKATALKMDNVTFLESIPKTAIPTWLMQMDGLFIGLQHCPLYRFGVSPNKLFDYMMAGKPIVYATSAGNDPVQEANCGISVVAEDSQAIARGILALYQAAPEQRLAMGCRGREFVLARHTYPVLAAQFLAALKQGG